VQTDQSQQKNFAALAKYNKAVLGVLFFCAAICLALSLVKTGDKFVVLLSLLPATLGTIGLAIALGTSLSRDGINTQFIMSEHWELTFLVFGLGVLLERVAFEPNVSALIWAALVAAFIIKMLWRRWRSQYRADNGTRKENDCR